jgi:hypothetical protein
MNNLFRKILFCFMILALVSGFSGEVVYANAHQDCSCCATNKCHSNAKCHDTSRACVCSYQVTQAYSSRHNTILPVLVFAGYLVHKFNFDYYCLSVEDIFHPPKA